MIDSILMVLGMLGGIFDSPIEYIYDLESGIDKIGTWQAINQRDGETTARVDDDGIYFVNTAQTLTYCYGHTRNKTPIDIKSYNYVYVHFVNMDFKASAGEGNKIRIYVNPDLTNDDFPENAGTVDIGTETNFFNGTYVSGSKFESTATHSDYTLEMDISAYSGKGGNFRIITTIGPYNSVMWIDKIYLSRYKLT